MTKTMKRFDKENDYNKINTDYLAEDLDAPFAGYLMKKSSAGKWQKRYFEINGNYLIYYKDQSMGKLLAAVSIPQLGDLKLLGEVHDEKGDGFVIQLDLKDKQYFLRTETQDDAEKWITRLLYVRDGELAKGELKRALNASPSNAAVKSVTFVDIPTYNPQHKGSKLSSRTQSESLSSEDEADGRAITPENLSSPRQGFPKRFSDANWKKSHRSILYYCCFL